MNSKSQTPTDVQIGKVMVCRQIYNNKGLIYCRKCCKTKEPLNINDDFSSYNDIEKEQYISGICSNECWEKSSEEELMLWKYIHPLYLSDSCVKTKKLNAFDKDTGKIGSLPLYDGEVCLAEFQPNPYNN